MYIYGLFFSSSWFSPEVRFPIETHSFYSTTEVLDHSMAYLLKQAKQIYDGLLPWPPHKFFLNELLTLFDVNILDCVVCARAPSRAYAYIA